MKTITLLLLLAVATPCYAGMVCLEKETGKLIEYQSNATPGTLASNARNAGYKPSEVEEKEVTDEEWAAIKKQQIDDPAKQVEKAKESDRKELEAKVRAKLGLTAAEFKELRESLR